MTDFGKHLQMVVSNLTDREKQAPNVPCVSCGPKPAISDRLADLEIPNRLWSAWTSGKGARAIIRAMTDAERAAVVRRREELRAGLVPIGPQPQGATDREMADSSLSAMIDGFRAIRLTSEQLKARVELLLMLLAEFPGWAIARACQKIMTNKAGLRPEYAPNDAEIYAVTEREVEHFRSRLRQAEALLEAPVEPPACEPVSQPDPTPAQRAEMARELDVFALKSRAHHGDAAWNSKTSHGEKKPVAPGYMERVLADIEGRKAARSEPA